MPPKNKGMKAQTIAKKTQKVVEDKTFGLKNKNKSKKVQAYIESVQKTAGSSKAMKDAQKAKEERQAAKKKKEEQAKQLEMLFKSVGGDNAAKKKKTVKICPYFIKGKCPRGDECKLSHDWGDTRKVQKLDVYADLRDGTDLEPESDLTCRHFVEAVETKKFGHKWICPNGGPSCQYRHKLPKGYVIKSDAEKAAEMEEVEEVPLEEQIEIERSALLESGVALVPVTLETFQKWKEDKAARRKAEMEARRLEAAKKLGNKGLDILSGRDLFQYDPTLFVDDENAAEDTELAFHSDREDDDVVNVEKDLFLDDEDLPNE